MPTSRKRRLPGLTLSRSGLTPATGAHVSSDIHSLQPALAKDVIWLAGPVKTPPFTETARVETGRLLRRLQRGQALLLPWSRPMPAIGARCHELRTIDVDHAWRIMYRVDRHAVVVAEVVAKRTEQTPRRVIETCRRRLREYDCMNQEG